MSFKELNNSVRHNLRFHLHPLLRISLFFGAAR